MPRPRNQPDELADQLRYVIGAARRRVRAEFADDAVAFPLQSVLRRLDGDGPATTADLARAELVTPQTMGTLVAELEDLGYVVRRDDPDDGRRRVVALTAAGRRALARRRAARRSWLAQRISERLDARDQRTLASALELLRRIVEP